MSKRVKGLRRPLQSGSEQRLYIGRLRFIEDSEGIAFDVPQSVWTLVIAAVLTILGFPSFQSSRVDDVLSSFLFSLPFLLGAFALALFYFAGNKRIVITPAELNLETEWLGRSWTRSFDTQGVCRLRFVSRRRGYSVPQYPSNTRGMLIFDYDGLPRYFARGIRENEAIEVLKRLRRRFPVLESAEQNDDESLVQVYDSRESQA